jgi:hypothetical protein
MIDSAITPEPIVATVRLESGDMSAIIGAPSASRGLVSREIGPEWAIRRQRIAIEMLQTDEGRSPREEATGRLISS